MKVVIVGDFCPRGRVVEKFEQGDYEYVLGKVKDIISDADYSIVNFECPVTKGGEKPIEKCGPNLQCSEKGMEAVKWAGFDCVTLANNHFFDYGKEGVKNTLEACKKYGVDFVGGGMNLQEASEILFKEIDGKILAIINCCEHEFSIATEDTAGSNPLNPIKQYYAVKEAKEKADYVLVIVHGGNEHFQLPSPRMQEIYRFFIDAGADAVVNHHQHCYSGFEVYSGKPIFYGLGNFCFDKKGKINDKWNEGYMVIINLCKNNISFDVIPYNQCSEKASLFLQKNKQKQNIIDSINNLNIVISNKDDLKKKYTLYIEKNSSLRATFSPYTNKLLRSLCSHGLLPSFLPKKKKLLIQAYIQCESHLPKVMNFLKK